LEAVEKRAILTPAVPQWTLSLQSPCRGSSNLGVAAPAFQPLLRCSPKLGCPFLGTVHAYYSAFQLDPTGHVAVRMDLNCIDDQDAMRQAEMLVDASASSYGRMIE
jgi:hypothetical protein